MATLCSTRFRSLILGPSSFESIFNGGKIEIYSGVQPASADLPASGLMLAEINAPGGLQFARADHYATNTPTQVWTLDGSNTGVAAWARLRRAVDDGAYIDCAIGPDDESPGDFQMRLPTLSITPGTSIIVSTWWFLLPPL